MGLREILATQDWAYVGTWLSTNYIKNDGENARRREARERDDLYDGKGDEHMNQMLEQAYKARFNQDQRKVFVPWSKLDNVTARIVNETAAVYDEPAKRTCSNGTIYTLFQDAIDIDAHMREVDRKLVLHGVCYLGYRVTDPNGKPKPVLDVVSPANFWAVAHPKDPTELVAIVLDQTPKWADKKETDPHYRVWTDDETFQLDGNCKVIVSSVEKWPLGRIPGVLAAERPPGAKQSLMEPSWFSDVVAGHKAVKMQYVLLLKESKSANKQTYLTGDTSATVPGQAGDTDSDVVLGEGVVPSTLDRGMDLSQFRENATHIADVVGANRGLPPSVRQHRDASSGAEIHLRRIPIRELRKRRIPTLRRIEREIAEVEAGVNKLEVSAWAFDMDGWGVDFGEVQQPMTAMESLDVFEKGRQLLLTDTVVETRRRNPDLKDDAAAWAEIDAHVENETRRVQKLRDLQQLDGGVRTGPDDKSPEQNGADGRTVAQDTTA